MNFKEYQKLSSRTINKTLSKEDLIKNNIFGLVGETGEVIDLMKKVFFHSHDLDINELKKELGDVLWYLASTATVLKLDINYKEISELKCFDNDNKSYFIDLIKSIQSLTNKLTKKPNYKTIFYIIKETLININVICLLYNIDFKMVLKENVQKLMERYPEGFDINASINRKEGV